MKGKKAMVAGWLNVFNGGGTGGNGWATVNTASGASTLYTNAITNSTPTFSTYQGSRQSHQQAIALLMAQQNAVDNYRLPAGPSIFNVPDGIEHTIKMPDGTMIHVAKDGSFHIDDAEAKVVYRANRVRNFNPFLNASDKLEEFIKFCGEAGVRQGEMLSIPIQHFIAWLVIEAAKADGETPTSQPIPALPDLSKPRCRVCKRFISSRLKADRIEFCRPICLEAKLGENNGSCVRRTSRRTTWRRDHKDQQVPAQIPSTD